MIGSDIRYEIKIHLNKLEIYKIERDYLLKTMSRGPDGYKPIDYSGMPHGSGAREISLDREYNRLMELEDKIEIEQYTIRELNKQISEMELNINKLKGIDLKVVYLRDYDGLSLQEIAEKLNYEVGSIKHISARNKKKGI